MDNKNKKGPRNPSKSGNPAIAAGAVKASTNGKTLYNAPVVKMPTTQKIITVLSFIIGFSGAFLALEKIRPHGEQIILLFSNIFFGLSGGFLAVIISMILIGTVFNRMFNNTFNLSLPRYSKKYVQKLIIIAVVFAFMLGGALASFSAASNPNQSVNPDTGLNIDPNTGLDIDPNAPQK